MCESFIFQGKSKPLAKEGAKNSSSVPAPLHSGWYSFYFPQPTHQASRSPHSGDVSSIFMCSSDELPILWCLVPGRFPCCPPPGGLRSRVTDLETSSARRGAIGGRQRVGQTLDEAVTGARHRRVERLAIGGTGREFQARPRLALERGKNTEGQATSFD